MNVVYRTQLTEIERGIGRPDGVAYAFRKERLDLETRRRHFLDAPENHVVRGPIGMCIVTPELSRKIYENGGIYTTIEKDDPGMLGAFIENNPKANLELYKRRMAEAALAA